MHRHVIPNYNNFCAYSSWEIFVSGNFHDYIKFYENNSNFIESSGKLTGTFTPYNYLLNAHLFNYQMPRFHLYKHNGTFLDADHYIPFTNRSTCPEFEVNCKNNILVVNQITGFSSNSSLLKL